MSEDVPAQLAGFRPGSRLAGYRLEAQVGAGGMAVVFRARDERLGRLVALKILVPGLASDPAFRRRFIAESRAAATVDDPHIIPVYEAGEGDGVLFIAMRFVPGGDLRGVLYREGPLRSDRAAEFVSPVASALDAAHRAGLVHRDVKPANILVDASTDRPDHVYLSDFGVSKGAMSSVSLTGAGQYLGTPEYSAPEQIQGRVVDGRTDQYALACVAYQLLTGAVPFERDQGIAVLLAHLSEPPPPLGVGLPAAADLVLARAMAKTPEKRYGSCREFADALREALGLARYRSRGPVSAPGQPSAEAGSGKPAVPADLMAATAADSLPGDGSVPAVDASASIATAPEPARPATGVESGAWPPTVTAVSGEGIPAAAARAASQPPADPGTAGARGGLTGDQSRPTAAADKPVSAANVLAANQSVRSGMSADSDGARSGRRPRRFLFAIGLAFVVLAAAGTVPLLLNSSPSNSGSPSKTSTSGNPVTNGASGNPVTNSNCNWATATSAAACGGMSALVAAAEKEGQLNVITLPSNWANYGAIMADFSAKYHIHITSANPDGSSQDELNAVNQLKGQASAPDVLDVGTAFAVRADQEDILAPYEVATYSDIPSDARAADGTWYADYGGYIAIGYNSATVKTPPTSFASLLNPIYKNEIAINGNPTEAFAAFSAVYAAALANGGSLNNIAPGIAYFKKLYQEGNFVPVTASAATMESGQTPIIIWWDYLLASEIGPSVPGLKIVIPSHGVYASYYDQAISKYAPDPAAARLWEEFLYSAEGQNLWLEGETRPIELPTLEADGTVNQTALKALPPAPSGTVTFPTQAQTAAAEDVVAQQWPSAIG